MSRTRSQTISEWEKALRQSLPLYGHRNWIVIADSAYPNHSNPGIETIATGTDHLEVLKRVLAVLAIQQHVRPVIYTDYELARLSETDAPGVNVYRLTLSSLLGKQSNQALPHDEIISRLDKAATLFRVLILKTTLCIPYTSVFLNLECGYWTTDAEARLRASLSAANTSPVNSRHKS